MGEKALLKTWRPIFLLPRPNVLRESTAIHQGFFNDGKFIDAGDSLGAVGERGREGETDRQRQTDRLTERER